ncbi:hypothetical protein FNU76_17095 [Chitinimonas arctica]|uniref:DUF1579 domain-containing protein n=1 Tax=Chitinimonas arctica TaxID=2594795 RepID=A0A516SIE2_9NEIS|nr:hypothetical protein [Chitinimonas arctica]QDQ27920.1 hypothetical protein FNU76_17095 [Chitinimonas arctica]
MDETRRNLILAAGAAAILPTAALAADGPALDTVPPLPRQPTPGKPGDFDFLAGEWKIRHWRLPAGATEWDRFEGEATCWTILGGVGSVEELRIPARNFSGMGLRLLDVEKKQWSDFWVNGRSGVLAPPGLTGSFENGVGLFWAEEEEAGRKTISLGIWDRITPRGCRWRQAVSEDGGRTWAHNWVMEWRRA